MTTGARSVEFEDPEVAQLTVPEMTALVEEAHRLGRRVAAHCEGTPGVELALDAGVDTIEHGMYLHARPDLLDRMAATETTLVPTLSCYYGVGPEGRESWAPHLVDLANRNLEDAGATLRAAVAAGGRAVALTNRCPHRKAPLSDGRVLGDNIECPFHGMLFSPSGSCLDIPCQAVIPTAARGRAASSSAIRRRT